MKGIVVAILVILLMSGCATRATRATPAPQIQPTLPATPIATRPATPTAPPTATQQPTQPPMATQRASPPVAGSYVCANGERCIKGNINAEGQKIYHFPGCASYAQTQINENAGERWFTTAAEAQAAGWRKAQNCP